MRAFYTQLFGWTTQPQLSLLAFICSYSEAAGLLSHTIPPEIFIKVSLLGRLLGIHSMNVRSHSSNTKHRRSCSHHHTLFLFKHPVERIVIFSTHPSLLLQIPQPDFRTDAHPCIIAGGIVPPDSVFGAAGWLSALRKHPSTE